MAIRRPSRLALIAAVCALFLFSRLLPRSPVGPAPYVGKPLVFQPASFNWSAVPEHFPVTDPIASLPTNLKSLPRVQYSFPTNRRNDAKTESRREAVKHAFQRSWTSYKTRAWGHDELTPVTGGAKDNFGGWAATLVDALDTLWIMDLRDDFRAAAAVAVQLDWATTGEKGINMFETTIRHLGGLLSAYDLSQQPALLKKAQELGEMLYHGFDTPSRMPGFWLTFENAKTGRQVAGTHDPSASPSSLAMEFTRLAQLTGEAKYFDAVDRVRRFLADTQETTSLPGMWPVSLDFHHLSAKVDNTYSLGALADSLYEYLLKTYILLGGADDSWRAMYERAMQPVEKHLIFRPMLPDQADILLMGTANVNPQSKEVTFRQESEHLECFAGGMLALGGKVLENDHHVRLGSRLAKGCAWAYHAFPTGLMPEIFWMLDCPSRENDFEACHWDEERWLQHGDQSLAKGFQNAREPHYYLRPEAIESLFILYRITGEEALRDSAWEMFGSIVKATETEWAYSAIADVTATDETVKRDSMESFWLSETLKYFYLIFSPPDVISLDEYVFTTEAHPFKRPR